MDIKQLDKEYIVNSYNRFPLLITEGKGALLKDENGNEYIDLGSGIAVNSFGACDDEWADAVALQCKKLQHTSNLFYTEPCVKLAQMLCEKTGLKKVFFSNSGAESNECAIKCARKYAFDKYGDYSHSKIITLKNSFHGRTLLTLSATGQDTFHTSFGPFCEEFLYCDANDPQLLLQLASENDCCAIMIEVVQGEGGVNKLSDEFICAVNKAVKDNDLLLIVDEVQTGNGRTGKLYGYMNFDLNPDIVSTAKGLAGGLPIGATMFGEKTKDVFDFGSHGTTFGGNPVCCAAAISVMSRIDDAFLDDVNKKSKYIIDELSNAKGVKNVTGLGLMLGIETQKPVADVIKECREQGVLVLSAKTKVRLLPPLNIEFSQLEKAIRILKGVIEK